MRHIHIQKIRKINENRNCRNSVDGPNRILQHFILDVSDEVNIEQQHKHRQQRPTNKFIFFRLLLPGIIRAASVPGWYRYSLSISVRTIFISLVSIWYGLRLWDQLASSRQMLTSKSCGEKFCLCVHVDYSVLVFYDPFECFIIISWRLFLSAFSVY